MVRRERQAVVMSWTNTSLCRPSWPGTTKWLSAEFLGTAQRGCLGWHCITLASQDVCLLHLDHLFFENLVNSSALATQLSWMAQAQTTTTFLLEMFLDSSW